MMPADIGNAAADVPTRPEKKVNKTRVRAKTTFLRCPGFPVVLGTMGMDLTERNNGTKTSAVTGIIHADISPNSPKAFIKSCGVYTAGRAKTGPGFRSWSWDWSHTCAEQELQPSQEHLKQTTSEWYQHDTDQASPVWALYLLYCVCFWRKLPQM